MEEDGDDDDPMPDGMAGRPAVGRDPRPAAEPSPKRREAERPRYRKEASVRASQAEESAALSRARFGQGGLLTAELLASESRLVETRMRHIIAVSEERIALVELRRSLGLAPAAPALTKSSQ